MKILFIHILLIASSALFGAETVAPVSGATGEAGHQDGTGDTARFNDPTGLARDAAGNLYLCDSRNHVIRKIAPGGIVTTLAGKPGEAGALDGHGDTARFHFPSDIAVAPGGTLYVADSGNHCIRVIAANGAVTTLAGDLGNSDDISLSYSEITAVPAQLDGKGATARFNNPGGIAYAPGGHLYVSDTGNHTIRRVNLDGTTTTVAGSTGAWGSADGTGSNARFSSPMGMSVGTDGNLYIADSMNHAIRSMTPQGTVTTFAGNPLEAGFKPGPRLDARFLEPTDIVSHPDGGFIICESFGNALFRLTADGNVTLFAGDPLTGPKSLAHPNSAVCDAAGNVYLTDTFHQEVRLIIEKFGTTIQRGVGGANQLTLTWDSLPGRAYQIQILGENGWQNTPQPPVLATTSETSATFPMPSQKTGIYRILLLGF